MNSELERCGTCTVPVTWETVHLDSCGNCNICKNWGVKKMILIGLLDHKNWKKLYKM